jgi:hypothetical protein
MTDLNWTALVMFGAATWAFSAYWRPGSLALALSWGAAQAVWYVTGEQVPIWFYIPADLLVLAILLKYQSSRIDWIIAGCFPLAWQAYAWDDAVLQWWFLWSVMVFQLILAGPWKATRKITGSVTHGPGGQYVEAR